MGTKIILSLCFTVIVLHSVKTENVLTKVGLSDNISAESVSRLYRNGPVGVYASAVPYGAYSFQVPSVIAPKNIPIKEETILVQNSNGFLKDSYGNKYLHTPQALAYRATFPRQFIQLQNLPAHLSQPLVSPSSQFRQVTPHFFAPSQYNLQTFPQSTLSRYTLQQPLAYGNIQTYNQHQPQTVQQHSTTNINDYKNSVGSGNFNNLQSVPKFQRLQKAPATHQGLDKKPTRQETAQTDNSHQLQQVPKQTTITTLSNGQKISLNLITKPPVPLLDLNLLQPLTFANPVVPQVQHYLPRINQQIYSETPNVNLDEVKSHKMEFVVQNTKSYDSEDKPKNTKKVNNVESDEEPEIINDPPSENENPEFSYNIDSPNYKETYTEQKIGYNKKTESEPQTYTYEMKSEGKPVHYSYEKNTQKKPIVVSYEHHIDKVPVQHSYEEHTEQKPIHYTYSKTVNKEPHQHTNINNQSPKHLIFNIKPEEQANFEQNHDSHQHPKESSKNNSEESDDNKENLEYNRNTEKNHVHNVRYVEPSKNTHQTQPEQKQVQYYHTNNQQDPNIVKHYHVPQLFINRVHKNVATKQEEQEYFQPIVPEYEENIKLIHPHQGKDDIRVDPNQHIQSSRNPPSPPQNHPVTYEYSRPHYSASPVLNEKPKEDNTESADAEEEQEPEPETYIEPENSEENFEKSYKDAAYGFAAYDEPRDTNDRDIYNPEAYGVPRHYSEYNIEKNPFKQYESENDDYPKETRGNYKDQRDKMHEDYFLDFAVSKPTSLRDSYRNKENYYKMYKNNKPESYHHNDDDDKKKNTKYISVPSYEYYVPKQKQLKKQKLNPHAYEHDYSSEEGQDASAHATRPLLQYKSKTHFVEPQFQYGFEPISIPQLLDSELAAMASNNNPKSEKQGTRKKIYRENLFIKKTSTKGSKRISR